MKLRGEQIVLPLTTRLPYAIAPYDALRYNTQRPSSVYPGEYAEI